MGCSTQGRESLRVLVRGWYRAHACARDLAEAEELAEEVRDICGQVALEEALLSQSGRGTYRGSSVTCVCGGRARFVSYRRRWIKAVAGEVRLERAYYHCGRCGRGQSPWDREQGLNGLVWTPRTKALVSQSCGRLPYRETVELLGEAGVLHLEESSAEEIVLEVGGRLRAAEAAEEKQVREATQQALAVRLHVSEEEPVREQHLDVRPVCGERLYATLDAAKAHIDGEWHDVKVGAVYTVSADAEGVDTLAERTYVASQRTSEEFGWQLRTRAVLWNADAYPEKVVVADGAEYNWKVAETHFPEAVQVLDFFHAAEHVHSLARNLYRQDDPKEKMRGERWAKDAVHSLKEDGPARLLRSLKRRKPGSASAREALRLELGYFGRNRHRMDYPGFRRKGMMIGSGPVEAGCKVVVGGRMKQSGMRWSSHGADSILAVRTALLSHDYKRIQQCARAA
jgi:hypothetical protein